MMPAGSRWLASSSPSPSGSAVAARFGGKATVGRGAVWIRVC